MFCPKCGTNLPDDAVFCSKCGANINELKVNTSVMNEVSTNENKTLTTTEELSKKSKEFFGPKINRFKEFTKKNKKQLLISLSCFVCFIILSFIYSFIFGFEKLSWNKDYKDLDLKYVTQNTVKLGINFSNDKKLKKIKYKTTCGDYEVSDKEIEWDLSDSLGECKVEVSYKFKKITKKLTVIDEFINHQPLFLDTEEIDYDSDEDLDYDTLSNKQEKGLNTDPILSDTDMDGLDDGYEVNTIKTDPLKKDTDGDSLSDFDEIELGLDPLKNDSKGDGVKDGDRKLTYSLNNEDLGVTINLSGKGNIASTSINTFKNNTFKNINGLMDTVYNFYTDGTIENAEVTINYSLEDIISRGLDENNLVLYYFNDETKKLEATPTVVDKDNKKITVNLKHFSKYVLGDKSVVIEDSKTQIMMVIDNSTSMYTRKQMEAMGHNSSVGANGNDSSFKRITLTNKLIDMFTGNYYFGVAHFAGNYINLSKFTNENEVSKKAVNSIKNNIEDLDGGTNIVNALNEGISEFSKDDNNHYLVLLTDGKDTSYTLKNSSNTIIKNAKEIDVKVCVIGLGSSIDSDDLNDIAEGTGCDYYNANDANSLDEIYSLIAADINYNLVDTDKDGVADSTVIADSGFIVTRDGFSFDNYNSNLSDGGHCYGMATFAELYYTKKLPMSLGTKQTVKESKLLDKRMEFNSYAYNLSSTYFSRYDNLYDYKLKTNALKYQFGFENFGEEVPKDYYTVVDDVLTYKEDYKKDALNTGLYEFSIKESSLDSKKQIEKHGAAYSKYESLLLNEDKIQKNSKVDYNDKQLLNAIYACFIKQIVTDNYSSSMNFELWVRDKLGAESVEKLKSAAFIELLKSRLESGDVPVISSDFSNGYHAVNAISLAQHIDNPNHYSIGIYDNNYSGEKRYVDIICNKRSCVTEKGAYYSNSKKPIEISKSLEDDLAYFK